MQRRIFLKNSVRLAGAAAYGKGVMASNNQLQETDASLATPSNSVKPFNSKFSPDFGVFALTPRKNFADQIKWGYDNGFRAWECTMLRNISVSDQETISNTIQKLGMEFGQFVGTMDFERVTFAGNDRSLREKSLKEMKESVEIARRMNTRFIHNVLGKSHPELPYEFQMVNAIELLKRAADIYEPHGMVMVMETMNTKINHAGMFLHLIPQAYALSIAVGRKSIKMLFDFYHVQIEEGNLLPMLDYVWDEVGYIQIGDTPGRNEPTSGEINYTNVLQHVHDKGYRSFLGLEHGMSRPGNEGVEAALKAYRSIDPK